MTETASDARQPGFFIIDNEVIDNYELGPFAGWLYATIVRHVNHASGLAFPGLAHIADKAGMTEPTAIKYLYELVDKRLLCIYQTQDNDGSYFPNHYELLPVVKGGKRDLPGVVKDVENKKTKPKKTVLPEPLKNSGSEAGSDEPPAWEDLSKGDQHKALFGALCEAWGYATAYLTEQDRGEIGKVASQLRGANARPENMIPFKQWLGKHASEKAWSDYTIHAMIKYWKEFAKTLLPPPPPQHISFGHGPSSVEEQFAAVTAWYDTQEGQDCVAAALAKQGDHHARTD